MRSLIFLVLFISCGGNAEVIRRTLSIPYVLGGGHITFTEIKIEENAQVKCFVHFIDGRASIEVEPSVPRDRRSAICRLPAGISSKMIDIDLEITTNNGGSISSEVLAETLIIDPNTLVELTVKENWDTNELYFTWDPSYFNQFFNRGAMFMLQATLYVSNGADPVFKPSGIILIVRLNWGAAKVSISDANRNRISNILSPYYYVLMPVGTQSNVYLSSGLFAPTLGMNPSLAMQICATWLQTATVSSAKEIHPCPPSLRQAGLDANFIKTDYHPQTVDLADGALDNHVLYYERVPTNAGHAQTCSYNSLTTFLAVASPQAGWIHGVSKYGSYVDNYFADIWPHITCCLQNKNQLYCDRFHEKRPIDTGHTYIGPEDPCTGLGDPHIVTFDSVKYDFMGYGEFWLIRGPKGSEFGVQGRMSPNNPSDSVTYFKAVAMRDANTTVQIQLKEGKFQILLNGIEFRIPTLPFTLPLDSVFLTISSTLVDVRLQSGFTIKIQNMGTNIDVYGSGAHSNKGKGFMGLFGNFDDNAENDFTSQDGFVIPPTPENLMDMALIHHRFGLTWMTTSEESYFVYDKETSWEFHSKIRFGPNLQYPDPATFPDDVKAACGESLFCYYEYAGTGSLEKASEVARGEIEFDELREQIKIRTPLCDILPPIASGRVRVDGYVNGSSATYSCDPEYDFESENVVRTCSASEETTSWSGAEPVCIWTCTTCLPSMEFQLSHDPSDCKKFFLCSYGQRFSLDCPVFTSFDPTLRECTAEYECDGLPGC